MKRFNYLTLAALVAVAACTDPLIATSSTAEAWASVTAYKRAGQRSEIAFVVPWRTDVTATVTRLHIITTAETSVEFVDVPIDGFRHVWLRHGVCALSRPRTNRWLRGQEPHPRAAFR